MQQRSMCFQTMSCSRYFTSVERMPILTGICLNMSYGNGTYWCMCAKGGDISRLHHHSVSISEFSAHRALLLGRVWISGQSFFRLLLDTIHLEVRVPLDPLMK